MVVFSLLVIIFLSPNLIQATYSTNRDDLQDQVLTEIKKMMTLQSELIQSQADMLQKYGKRIALLEKENHHVVKQMEELQIANGAMKTRLNHLEQANLDIRPYADLLVVTTGQSKEEVKDQDQSQQSSPRIQDEAIFLADDKFSRMRKVADVDNHTAVGFYSRLLSPNSLQLGQHQIIEFDNVITNVGNGYDTRHGHFTAPVAGLYSLTSTILLSRSSNHQMHLAIVKNGVDVGHLFTYTAYDTGTRTVVLALAVGDMVWVRNNENNSPLIYGDSYSSFSGFLITPFSQGR